MFLLLFLFPFFSKWFVVFLMCFVGLFGFVVYVFRFLLFYSFFQFVFSFSDQHLAFTVDVLGGGRNEDPLVSYREEAICKKG